MLVVQRRAMEAGRGWLVAVLLGVPAAVAAEPLGASSLEEGPAGYVRAIPGEASDEPFWARMGEPALERLVGRAVSHNGDLLAAAERVVSARASARQAWAALWPTVGVGASLSAGPASTLAAQPGGVPGGVGSDQLIFSGSATLVARYQLDAWGRQRSQAVALSLQALASEGDRDAQALELAALVAEAYFDVASAAEQLDLLEGQLDTGEKLLELTQLSFETAGAPGTDVLQQRQQLSATRARIPAARAQLEQARSRLAAAVGYFPGELSDLALARRLPELTEPPPTGTPRALWRNRPQLRAAKRRVAASERTKEAAYLGLLPTLGLSAQGGYQGAYLEDEVVTRDFWNVGLQGEFNLFRGGADAARIDQAAADARATARQARQAYVQAVADVEGALASEAELRDQLQRLRAQVEEARLAYRELRGRYAQGVGSFVAVLQGFNALQAAELSEVQAHRALLGTRVRLHRALGGPWTVGIPGSERDER